MSTVAVHAHDATWMKRSLPWAGWILSAASIHPADERTVEADLRPLVRPGVGKDRLGNGHRCSSPRSVERRHFGRTDCIRCHDFSFSRFPERFAQAKSSALCAPGV